MRPIDADRLKDTLKQLDVECSNRKTARIISHTLQEIFPQIIDDEPTIEAEPVKRGQWIYNRRDAEGRHVYRCSECGFEVGVFPRNFVPWKMHEKYCTGCGARMDGD